MGIGGRTRNIISKQTLLKRELRDQNIKVSWTDPDDSLLEPGLRAVTAAWPRSFIRLGRWGQSSMHGMISTGPQSGLRPLPGMALILLFIPTVSVRTDEVFPWDHITAAVRKNFLFQDFSSVA